MKQADDYLDRKTSGGRRTAISSYLGGQPRFTLYSDSIKAQFFEDCTGLMSALHTLPEEASFWIDMTSPSREDIITCGQAMVPGGGFHPLTIEDIVEMDTREKCELFDHYLFIVVSTIATAGDTSSTVDPAYIYIGISERGIISMHPRPISHHVSRVLRRLDAAIASNNPFAPPAISATGGSNSAPASPDWILYALLDDFVDALIPLTKALEFEVDSIDDLVLLLSQADKSDMVRRIGIARKATTALLRILLPKRELFKSVGLKLLGDVGQTKYPGAPGTGAPVPVRGTPRTLLYMRDAQDHVLSLGQSLEHFRDTLNTAHSNYLAQISIELTDASNRMNEVVKRLTVFTVIFLPLTLLAGIMGMNVPLPLQPGVGITQLGPFALVMMTMFGLFGCLAYVAWRSRMF